MNPGAYIFFFQIAFYSMLKYPKLFNLNIHLATKYARFVVLGRLMYWTPPPPIRPLDPPPLLKSDDLFLGNQEILDPHLSKILDTPLIS